MRVPKFSTLSTLLLAVVTANLLSVSSASAKVNDGDGNDPYYQIASVKISEIADEEQIEFHSPKNLRDLTKTSAETVEPGGKAGGIIMIIDKLVAIGERVIPLVKEGRPIVTNNPMSSVSVLPRSNNNDFVVNGMGGWTIPYSKHYRVGFINGFGMEVISFVYSITYQFNGSLNGRGKYLTGIRASARDIDVAYGFDMDASSRLLQISNIGTTQNVIAGATIEMSYTVKSLIKTISTNISYFIAGDGRMWRLD